MRCLVWEEKKGKLIKVESVHVYVRCNGVGHAWNGKHFPKRESNQYPFPFALIFTVIATAFRFFTNPRENFVGNNILCMGFLFFIFFLFFSFLYNFMQIPSL